MTWHAWLGSSVQHAHEKRESGSYTTLCGLVFSYEPRDDEAANRLEACARCHHLAYANQLSLWEAAR